MFSDLKINLYKFIFLFALSFGICAFGQPGWIPALAPFAGCLGFAIFWKSLDLFSSKAQRFLAASVWYACVQMVQLSWMTSTDYQGAYILCVFVLLAIWLGLQFGAVSLLIPENVLAPIGISKVLAIASMWTIMEWARLYFLCGFSWNPVGMALTGFTPSMQLASVWGILGLSFWVFLSNLIVFKALFFKCKAHHYSIGLLIILFPYLFGWLYVAFHEHHHLEGSDDLNIVLVQTGLLPPEKAPLYGQHHLLVSPYDQWNRIIIFLKKERAENSDLIVLPEAAVPFDFDQTLYSFDIVEHILLREFGSGILTLLPPLKMPFAKIKKNAEDGWLVSNAFWAQALANYFLADVVAGLDVQDFETEGVKNYNAAFHFTPMNEGVQNRYEKRVLVPLAEYLPFDFLKPLVKRYGITEFFTPGKKAKVFQGKVPFSISICYEETFSHLIRESRQKGSKLFVNVTNDNWYPHSKLPLQHFFHGRLRAVENGVPLVRACNSGVTSAVDCFGRIVSFLGSERSFQEIAGALSVRLDRYQIKTLYTFWGDFGIICLCVICLIVYCHRKFIYRK